MKVRLILKPKSNSNTIRRNEKDWLATENEDLDMSGLKKKLQVAIEARESDVVEIVKREIARREGKRNGKSNSREYTCQFWEPGLVSYEDSGAGVALLRKETMDAMLPSMIGAPVVIDHMDGSAEEIKNSGKSVGTVTNAYWNPETGWYECTFTADTSDAEEKINDGWSVSCAFDVSEETGPGGEYHAMRYDEEIKSGTFTHLALVQTPRYEDSRIFKNTKKLFLNSKKARLIVRKNSVDAQKIRAIEAMLANDEASSDAELVEHFVKELGLTQQEAQSWVSKREKYLKNAKENAKTVAISIPYKTISDVADKKGISESELEQMLVGKGLISVGAGGGTADYEFNGSETQAASAIQSVLGTMNGVDLGMIQNAKENGVLSDDQKFVLGHMREKSVGAYPLNGKWIFPENIRQDDSIARTLAEEIRSGKRNEKNSWGDTPGDFGTLLREIKEQLYQIAQAVGMKQRVGKENQKSSRAILKTASKNKKENNSMFGFFKRKKKENAAPVEEKLPVDQIDIEIDGVAVPLAELVNEYKAEQAEIAERNRLEKEAAAKAENAEPNPEKPAEEKPAGDQPAPEDLDLENQDFTVEDGSRYNMTDLINCWTKRKAAKPNAEAEARAKEESNKTNGGAMDAGLKAYEESLAKAKKEGDSEGVKHYEKAIADLKEKMAKENAQETPEEKAAREKKEAEEKAKEGLEKETKENSYGNYSIHKDLSDGISPEEVVKRIMARYKDIKEPQARSIVEAVRQGGPNAMADWEHKKENAKKRNPAYFHKLNDLKNDADEVTGKVIDTLSDRIARGDSRYGSKK